MVENAVTTEGGEEERRVKVKVRSQEHLSV
jgi:hypothetical protein